MANVVKMRPDAPMTAQQEVAAIVDDYLRDVAALGIDLTEQEDDEDEQE
jgi:hypothetical protein